MTEKLIPIKLPPGLLHNGTKYDAKGRWYDSNLIRWHEGVPQPIGRVKTAPNSSGFVMADTDAGTTKGCVMRWQSSHGERLVVATGTHVYANDNTNGAWTDITPVSGYNGNTTLDTFGGLLIIMSGNQLFSWDGTLATKAAVVVGAPGFVNGAVCTPERFLVALGGTAPDNNLVQWPDQETTTVWTPTPTNQAGSFPLATVGTVVTGRATKGQTLLFTSADVWSMTYIGGQAVYSFRKEGDACGIISSNAAVVAGDGRVFWMARNGFFVYDGYVRRISCDVHDKVFGEIHRNQITAPPDINGVSSMGVGKFNEIWWFYSTTNSAPNNRQVVYNYVENTWHYHVLDRICGLDSGLGLSPLMLDSTNGRLYEHESPDPTFANYLAGAYLESGPFEIGEGDQIASVQRIVPDGSLTAITATLYTAMGPLDTETATGPVSLASPTSVRVKGRQGRLRIDQVGAPAGAPWRLGTPRLGVIPSSKR